jgi:hypothetical protein
MKIMSGLFAALLLCAISQSQDTSQPGNGVSGGQRAPSTQSQPAQSPSNQDQSVRALRLAPGSVIPVRLTKTIDSKKAAVGNEVEAQVTQDLKAVNGQVLVPKDTKVIGHITEAQPRSKEQKESQVAVAFDRAVINSGEVRMPMSIQAIIAPQNPRGASNASDNGAPSSPQNTGVPSANNGRPGTGGASQQGSGSATNGGDLQNSEPTTGANPGPQITGNTEGVIGMSNVKLGTTADASGGSVVSSEKGNVKLESGTFMLLRVTQ